MSLLLESLKKAALEKREKEKYSDSQQADVQVPSQISTQVDTSVDQNQSAEREVEIELSETKLDPSEEIEFNIDEVEYLEDPDDATQDVLPVHDITNTSPPQEGKSECSQNSQLDNSIEGAGPDKADQISPVGTSQKNNEEPVNKLSSFTPESGKAAFTALLEKNNKIERSNHIRRNILVGALFTTAILILGAYYYFLQDSSNSLTSDAGSGLYTHQTIEPEIESASNLIEAPVDDSLGASSVDLIDVEIPIQEIPSGVNKQTSSETLIDNQSNPASTLPLTKESSSTTVATSSEHIRNKNTQSIENREQFSEGQSIDQFIQSHPKMGDSIAQNIRTAYEAYNKGQWPEARILYQDVLLQDAFNRDAILGLAAIAVRQGNANEALSLYQQQLERDPKDEYAISGIMALSLDENKIQLLADVDKLLKVNPGAVHLLMLKGRLLAIQQQWLAAQEVFFNAWLQDKNNADIAYNLAVCLDRLSQPQEAIRFYQMALSLKTPAASFSSDLVEKRLASLMGPSS